MQPLQPVLIAGYTQGQQQDKKPFLLPDQAFPRLENAYVWRERVKKRLGNELIGRLRRNLSLTSIGNISAGGAGTFSFNIFTGLGLTGQANAQIEPGDITNISIAIGAPISQTLTDTAGTGVLVVNGAGLITAATINYSTGVLTITFSGAAGVSAATFTGAYYPSLSVTGIHQREVASVNQEQTIFFDTKYAYIYNGTNFQEFIPGTTWDGSDSDLFWAANYRGAAPEDRLFFVTNFINTAANPMRYVDIAGAWQTFAPAVDASNFLFQARILIPYYGRLIALNVWEGNAIGSAANIFNRCRFSQIGSPIASDAWRSDQFGKGGFIDAPTNEAITSAAFFKNTLVVFFERSTWQLRYVGEYGLPFIWERISSDFGSESTFSTVLFDDGVLGIGDKAIISTNSVNVNRIDEAIPDLVFTIRNADEGPARVVGIRDFQKELVYWTFPYSVTQEEGQEVPNRVLVYNYRNNTFATFRDNVTFFGTLQSDNRVTWDSTDVFWGDEDIYWVDADSQTQFPFIVSGNQQGFIHKYGYVTQDESSLSITAVDMTVSPNQITIPNHNLEDFDIVFLQDLTYSSVPPIDLNDQLFMVKFVDADTVSLFSWDGTQYIDTPVGGATIYIGNGVVTLFPRLYVATKDFNPYLGAGTNFKLSYIDFLTDATPSAVMTVLLNPNTAYNIQGNVNVGNPMLMNTQVPTYITQPYYTQAPDMAWHRFYASLSGQFIRVVMTYDESLMNDIETHQQDWTLNAMTLWVRPGGKSVFQ